MITYKIIESTVQHFKNIEIPFDFSECKVGQDIDVLGLRMKITQLGSNVVGCANTDNILIFQKISS